MTKHRNQSDKLWEIAESVASPEDLVVVSLEVKGQQGRPHVVVVLYRQEDKVTVGDCQKFNDLLGARLELEEDLFPEGYYLEVSSPGLDRTLATDREFDIFRGRTVEVNTYAPVEGKKHFTGSLKGLCEGEILIVEEDGTTYHIPREMAARTKLYYEL